jgi:uncharacterized membrane protein YphA (DoxX/SURF4 family)
MEDFPMAGTRKESANTEAVAVFHDVESFQAAIDDLLLAGFDHGDINVLAHEETVKSKLGREYQSTAEFEDNPEAPRIGFVPEETIGDAEGAVIGAGVYVPAIAGSLAVVASGGTLLGAFAVAAIAGGAGGLIGAAFARKIGSDHARHLEQHLSRGGLLLWVRTRGAEREKTALEILRRHSAEDVHLHELPERAGKESDIPRERPRVLHLLDWTIDFRHPLQRQAPR